MIKKSLKYFGIAFVNGTILTIFLATWTDKLELALDNLVRPIEFLKIIGFGISSLIVMRILVYFFRKKNFVDIHFKIKIASLLTLLISSYLYIDYFSKLADHIKTGIGFRQRLADKIKPAKFLGNGSKAEGLTIEEYQILARRMQFPELPNIATSINYRYAYDGFLPDYLLDISYDLPIEAKADTIKFDDGHFTKSQTINNLGNKKRISYSEVIH